MLETTRTHRRTGAAGLWLAAPPKHIVLSVANFKLYLNGIAPYVLICNLLILLTILSWGELPYAVAVVHLFSLLYSIAGYQRPSLYAFFCRQAFGLFLRRCCSQECCWEYFVAIPWSTCARVFPCNPRAGVQYRRRTASVVLRDARLVLHSSAWIFLNILPKLGFVRGWELCLSDVCKLTSNCGLTLNFPDWQWVEHLFILSLVLGVSLWGIPSGLLHTFLLSYLFLIDF